MGLTRCYKTEGFLHWYLQFLYTFYAIRYTRLRRRKSICIQISMRYLNPRLR